MKMAKKEREKYIGKHLNVLLEERKMDTYMVIVKTTLE